VPVILAVEDGERLGDVEVKPGIWWKCPIAKVLSIGDERNTEDESSIEGV
jgi:hypothetical protein